MSQFTNLEDVQAAMMDMQDREEMALARGDEKAAATYAAEWERLAHKVLPTFTR